MTLRACVSLTKCLHIYLLVLLTINFGSFIPSNPSSILVNASQSGIYVDNSRDQTIMHRPLDEEEKVAATYDILEFVGLPESPRGKYNHLSLGKSAPQFLLDVYQRLTEEEICYGLSPLARTKCDLLEQEDFFTDLDKEAIDQSDTIMTFLNKNDNVDEESHELRRHLWFDVEYVPDNNYVMVAVLRMYKNQGKWAGTGTVFTITVYSIAKTNGHGRELEVLSSTNTTVDYQGWLEMNVTEGLSSWLQDPIRNRGIYIRAHDATKPDKQVKLHDIGLTHRKGDGKHHPFIIGFFKGPKLSEIVERYSHQTRSTYPRCLGTSGTVNPIISGTRSCGIKTLYVDFKDLGWSDWIIAPEGYGAYYCSGECNFPLSSYMNATNHAIVQTLVNLSNTEVPKASCVPTRLGNLPLLYYIQDDIVGVKIWKNMVAKSCGCH